jgi:hypothetical protein
MQYVLYLQRRWQRQDGKAEGYLQKGIEKKNKIK